MQVNSLSGDWEIWEGKHNRSIRKLEKMLRQEEHENGARNKTVKRIQYIEI